MDFPARFRIWAQRTMHSFRISGITRIGLRNKEQDPPELDHKRAGFLVKLKETMNPLRKLSRSWAHNGEIRGDLACCPVVYGFLWTVRRKSPIWWMRKLCFLPLCCDGHCLRLYKSFSRWPGSLPGWMLSCCGKCCGHDLKPRDVEVLPPNTRQRAWFSCNGK